ncbi:hypothetical protein [Caloramator sp. mosi_1]|uniref:hypothetical protein n=1 Tax=Caloramator sp. mosi_1 TaxID=3023090 RepID=UPI003FCCB1CF
MTKTNFYRSANFKEGQEEDTFIEAKEVAAFVDFILSQRQGIVVTDVTIKPQRHMIVRK